MPFPTSASSLRRRTRPALASAESFIAERGANLLARIKSWGVETACFATSAVGKVEAGRPARELAPSGYTEIFDWVVATTRRSRRERFTKRFLIPIGLALLAGSLALFLHTKRAKDVTADSSRSLESRVGAARGALITTPGLSLQIDALVAEELGSLRERFSNLRSSEELTQIRGELALVKSLPRNSRSHEIDEFSTLLEEGDRRLRLRRIRSMEPADPELLSIAQEFIKDYPAAAEATEVEALIARIRDLNDETDREKVRRVSVQKGDLDSLNRKAAAIMEYVIRHRSAPESENMERAAAVARRLASTNPLVIRVSGQAISSKRASGSCASLSISSISRSPAFQPTGK